MKESLLEYIAKNKATIIAVILAIVTAILFMTIGFWRTVLFVGLILVGFKCGSIIDSGDNVTDRFITFCLKIKDIFSNKT